MVCQNCNEYQLIYELEKELATKKHDFQLSSIDDYSTLIGTELKCDNCNSLLGPGEYFFSEEDFEDVIENIFSLIAEDLSSNIESCEYCSAGLGGLINDMRHTASQLFYDEDDDPDGFVDELDVYQEAYSYVESYSEFCAKYTDNILKYLYCPACASDELYMEDLHSYSKIHTKEDVIAFEESFYGEIYTKIDKEVDRIASVCSENELKNLRKNYQDNHLFVYENSAFNKIHHLIKQMYNDEQYFSLPISKCFFRVRRNKVGCCYTEANMWAPSEEESYQGRYNTTGFPVLYCGNTEIGVEKEITLKNGEIYNYAKFRAKKEIRLLQSNYIFRDGFEGFIEEPTTDSKAAFKKQYIITNILADIVKKVGYDGIVYVSTKSTDHLNYVFFNFNNDEILLEKVFMIK